MKTTAWLSCAIALSVAGILLAQGQSQTLPLGMASLFRVGDHVEMSPRTESHYEFDLLAGDALDRAKQAHAKLREYRKQRSELEKNLPADQENRRARQEQLQKWSRETNGFAKVYQVIAVGSDYVGVSELESTIDEFIPYAHISRVVRHRD